MLEALGNTIIVKVVYEQISTLIELPESAKENLDFHGEVISVSKDFKFKDEVKAGDRLVFPRNEGTKVYTDDGEFVSLHEERALALITD